MPKYNNNANLQNEKEKKMSAIKNYIENEILRISKASGYAWDFLMDVYAEMIEDGEDDLGTLEAIAMEHDF